MEQHGGYICLDSECKNLQKDDETGTDSDQLKSAVKQWVEQQCNKSASQIEQVKTNCTPRWTSFSFLAFRAPQADPNRVST